MNLEYEIAMSNKKELHTHIPMDNNYTELLGKAVYAFAYYEWTIIYIIEHLEKGFVSNYCRSKKLLTSGAILKKFESLLMDNPNQSFENCKNDFSLLIEERNALIHAHPCTSRNGEQILNYQSSTKKMIHDLQWNIETIEEFIKKIDNAEIEAAKILDSFR
jgi:hypothetical protein